MKPSWDKTWFTLCYLMAMRSDDPDTHSGCVIVSPDGKKEVATGYNGLPRGIEATEENTDRNQLKYTYMEHCERNAIYNAASEGRSTKDCILYVNWYPCHDCARAMIQAGIKMVRIHKQGQEFYEKASHKKWGDSQKMAFRMLKEAGVSVEIIDLKLDPVTVKLSNSECRIEEL